MRSEKQDQRLDEDLTSSIDNIGNDGDAKEVEERIETKTHAPAGHVTETPEERAMNRRINLKMDFAMLPLLSMCYLFSGLDRGNIGNAETQGKSIE